MVGIDSINTTLTIDKTGLTPGVAFEPFISPKRAVFHLTKGYTLTKDAETIKHAWTAKGEGPGQSKSGTPGDEELGFLQTQEVDTIQFFYAGEKRSHGSMTIDVAPSISPKTCLDSEDNLDPWTSTDRSLDNGIWKAKTGDHPASRCPLRLGNVVTNKPNFLFHAIDKRRYVTILTYRLAKQFIPLRWFKWSVTHNVKIKWVGGKPKVETTSSSTSFGDVKVGPTDVAAVQKIIKKPQKPFGNFLTRSVIQGVVVGDLTGRTSNPEWFVNVPVDFWT
ncbi:MAG TPA: hypothetical protein PLX97_08210 [Gemmatales bacterium]|nr:hypothetical protein [Gemmatales bacterium]